LHNSFKQLKTLTFAIYPLRFLPSALSLNLPVTCTQLAWVYKDELVWSELVFPPEETGGIYRRIRAVTSHLYSSSVPRQRINKPQDVLPQVSRESVACGLTTLKAEVS
jgi:hypothetical protein